MGAAVVRSSLSTNVRPGGQGLSEWRQTRIDLPTMKNPGSGSVSLDGRLLAMTTEGGVAVADLTTKRDRVAVANDGNWKAVRPHWSPDGRELAYQWESIGGGRQTELRIVPRDGGPPRVAFARAQPGSFHGWSRDGRFLLMDFVDSEQDPSPEELLLVTVAGGSSRSIASRASAAIQHAVLSPDGHFVAFDVWTGSSQSSSIFVVNVENTEEHSLFPGSRTSDVVLDWPADDEFIFTRDGRASTVPVSLGRAAGSPSVVARDAGAVLSLGSAAGRKMYVLKVVRPLDLYVATLDPTTGTMLAPFRPLAEPQPAILRGPPVWSPNGTQLGFAKSGGIWTVRTLSNGAERDYGVELDSMTYPSWEPDGDAVIVRAGDGQGRAGLFRIDLKTEKVAYLEPGWRMLFNAKARDVVIVRRASALKDLVTGVERPIDTQGRGRVSARSRDGRLLAVWDTVAGNAALAIVPIDGSPRRTLVSQFPFPLSSTSLEFSPDDRLLYFVAGPQEEAVWRVPVEGGAPQPTGLEFRYIHDMSLSPDGRHLAIESRWQQTEVWVWERR
jgi:Tol biopolymer transport system component